MLGTAAWELLQRLRYDALYRQLGGARLYVDRAGRRPLRGRPPDESFLNSVKAPAFADAAKHVRAGDAGG